MLISDKHNFIFVHIYKTGGSSLTRLLGPHVDEQYRSRLTRFEGDGWQGTWHYGGRQHERLFQLRANLEWKGRDLSRYRLCTMVRNPYSWALSVWNDFYRKPGDAPEWFSDLYPDRGFGDFCRLMKAANMGLNPVLWGSYTQQSFIADKKLKPAFIGRFENLEGDAMRLLDFLGIEHGDIPHDILNNPMERSDPMRFYDAQSLDIVNTIFRADFEAFGYEMIEPRAFAARYGT